MNYKNSLFNLEEFEIFFFERKYYPNQKEGVLPAQAPLCTIWLAGQVQAPFCTVSNVLAQIQAPFCTISPELGQSVRGKHYFQKDTKC